MIRRALTTSVTTVALVLAPGAALAATSGTETVTTAVSAGTLTITTGGPVDLGRAKLDPGNEVLVARGDLGSIRVTDTRTADLGFTVTGVLTPFTATGGNRISAAALGWDPTVLRTGDGFDVTARAVRQAGPAAARAAAGPGPERPARAGLDEARNRPRIRAGDGRTHAASPGVDPPGHLRGDADAHDPLRTCRSAGSAGAR